MVTILTQTTPAAAWSIYGVFILSCLLLCIIDFLNLAYEKIKLYALTHERSDRDTAVLLALGSVICLCFGLFILFRRGLFIGIAFLIAIAVSGSMVGNGFKNQLTR